MCSSLLRLAPEKLQAHLGRVKREIQAITEEFIFAGRDHHGLRNFAFSSPWTKASVCHCNVSQHPCLCRSFPLPHTTVCPRGFCRAHTRPRAHSRPSRDINYTVQRVGVYLRCLRQVAGKDWSKALWGGFSSDRGCSCGLGLNRSSGVTNQHRQSFFLFTGNFPPTTRSNSWYHFDWVEWFGGNFLGFFISPSNLGFSLELFWAGSDFSFTVRS